MTDPMGYYALLGVQPGSSPETIKRAYRELAKKYHPDARDGGSSSQFRAINEAYVILIDPKRRADYDAIIQPAEPPPKQSKAIDPICCSECKRPTAQPRHLRFWKVYSVLIATVRVPVQGIYCAECAKTAALHATVFSSIAGWWGFPWGPIYTISTAITNIMGGVGSLESDHALLWYNAVAFHSIGNDRLAYGLALKVRNARDEKVAEGANYLLELLERRGVKPETAELKNPWAKRSSSPLKQIFAVSFIPTLVIGLTLVNIQGSRTISVYNQSPDTPYRPPSIASNEGRPDFRPAAPPTPPKKHCWFTPANGQVLSAIGTSQDIFNRVIIENGSEGNAIIKVKGLDRKFSLKFYVAERMTAQFDRIPDGQYEISYSSGELLGENCKGFDPPRFSKKFEGVELFQTEFTANSRITHSLTYTLFTVRDGNAHANNISSSDFDAE